jgi:hypothetical protein
MGNQNESEKKSKHLLFLQVSKLAADDLIVDRTELYHTGYGGGDAQKMERYGKTFVYLAKRL